MVKCVIGGFKEGGGASVANAPTASKIHKKSRFFSMKRKRTLTRAGPRGVFGTPFQFFADSAKTAARSAAVFGVPFNTSFSHIVYKFQPQVVQGQVK